MKTMRDEPLIVFLQKIIRLAVKALSILMTLVILWGVADVVWIIYERLSTSPVGLLDINDILDTFGAFMAVLIAIEIFINITVYLREETIHVKIVLATALVAIARKVIVLDFNKTTPDYIWATALVIASLVAGYWLITLRKKRLSVEKKSEIEDSERDILF